MYGPTETTIWSSALPVQGGVGPIPLGGPIANTRFEVLDDALRPVPLGAPGELLIGGAGVARGYLGRPDLTGERFVRPRDPAIGGRLYRTGDLVRWRTDGTLEFLGRLDQQVKLRGYRLELGEIEAALSADPAVVGAVAAVQPGASGEQRLVAFFVPRDPAADGAALAARLHETAAATLPAFLRPAAILPLAALPRTPNGKIDRRALPPADAAQSVGPARPFDATEQRLARLWRELLGPVKIAPESDFFGLGGDSLAASRLISRLQREFGRSLSFASLFEDATFARIARMVGGRGAEEQDPRIVVLRRGRAPRPLWGISTTTIFRKLAGRLALDLPFYVVRAQESELDAILACRTVEAIADYYLAALRRVQPAGPYALLGFCAEAVVAFEMARQLEHQGETVDVLVLIDAWAPGYLARMRPLRARLANLLYNTIRLLNGLGMALRTGRLGSLAVDLPPPPDPEDGPTAPALIHGHLAACAARYRPGPFGGRALVARSAVQPSGPLLDRDLGWARLVRGGVELVTVPGDHLGIFAEPGVDVLATGITGFARTNLQEGPLP
jgi:thioesterase domain-containing protein/acyl carrier protein